MRTLLLISCIVMGGATPESDKIAKATLPKLLERFDFKEGKIFPAISRVYLPLADFASDKNDKALLQIFKSESSTELVYPVLAENELQASITIEKSGNKWQLKCISLHGDGGERFESINSMLDKKIGHRLVYIRGINLEFVVNNEGDNLTPVFDIFLVDGNVLKAGETQKTKNVLRSLRQEAKHFKAKGKRW